MLNPAELAHIKLDDARNQYNRAFWGMATDRESRMRFYQKRIDYWAAVRSSLEEQLQICVCSVQLFVTDAHDADRISIPPRLTKRQNQRLRKVLRIDSPPTTTPLRELRVDI